VLIDLQTGRMLNSYENESNDRDARKRLQDILDIKFKAKKIDEYVGKLTSDVRKLVVKYRR
jgi:hypothetical protein